MPGLVSKLRAMWIDTEVRQCEECDIRYSHGKKRTTCSLVALLLQICRSDGVVCLDPGWANPLHEVNGSK